MVTTNERSPMAASIRPVARIWLSAPSTTHGQNVIPGTGTASPADQRDRDDGRSARTESRTGSAHGSRPRCRACAVSSRCIALRAVCAAAAITVNSAHSQPVSVMRRPCLAKTLCGCRVHGALPSSHSRSEWWGGVRGGGLLRHRPHSRRAAKGAPPPCRSPPRALHAGGGGAGGASARCARSAGRRSLAARAAVSM